MYVHISQAQWVFFGLLASAKRALLKQSASEIGMQPRRPCSRAPLATRYMRSASSFEGPAAVKFCNARFDAHPNPADANSGSLKISRR